MNSSFRCPHCSLPMEAEPEYFGVECTCPECAQIFQIPAASAILADREAVERLGEEKERLEGILAEIRGQLSSLDAEGTRLAFELEDAKKGIAEERKRQKQQEAEVALLKKNLTEADAQSGQYQILLNERNRLQERIQELNVQQKASEPVPETWVYSGVRQGERNSAYAGGGMWRLCVGAFLGASLVVFSSPFLFKRYPALAYVLKGEDRTLEKGALDSESEPEAKPEGVPVIGAEGLSQKLLRKEGDQGKRLPETFLGFGLGQPMAERWTDEERGLWKELNGRFQRPSELVGHPVTAVLVPDAHGRLLTGAYVRICGKDVAELTPFLEWAVSVQDQMSASWGEPSGTHQVAGVGDISEVVLKIRNGGDYYEAIWGRDGENIRVVMSIRSMNERSVVFRLEYRTVEIGAERAVVLPGSQLGSQPGK